MNPPHSPEATTPDRGASPLLDPIEAAWITGPGEEPIVATAIHDGHLVRAELLEHLALHAAGRLREEDPFTAEWTTLAETRIVGLRSRFEVDLNRAREQAVYLSPADAWGLRVWKSTLPPELRERSLLIYDRFYSEVRRLFEILREKFGRFVVLDLHSYNHRRDGPDAPPAPEAGNPEINVGTGGSHRKKWERLVDRFVDDLRESSQLGRRLDVRENVKFRGGHFSKWIHENFPEAACCLSVEVKKFFMNEWTGDPLPEVIEGLRQLLSSAKEGLLEEIQRA